MVCGRMDTDKGLPASSSSQSSGLFQIIMGTGNQSLGSSLLSKAGRQRLLLFTESIIPSVNKLHLFGSERLQLSFQ